MNHGAKPVNRNPENPVSSSAHNFFSEVGDKFMSEGEGADVQDYINFFVGSILKIRFKRCSEGIFYHLKASLIHLLQIEGGF